MLGGFLEALRMRLYYCKAGKWSRYPQCGTQTASPQGETCQLVLENVLNRF
jgi:hypothetical protein